MNNSSSTQSRNTLQGWIFSRTGVATVICLAVLGFLIYEGHGAHLLGLLPYALLLACPLMHVFMHGGHHHGSHRPSSGPTTPPASPTDASPLSTTDTEKPPAGAANPQQHKHRGC